MGNCEKSAYYERQKSRQQAQEEQRQTHPAQNDSERAQSANDKIVIPPRPSPVTATAATPQGSIVRQVEQTPQQLCKLISNYGQLCNHPECGQEIKSTPIKFKSPSKLHYHPENLPE